MAFGTITDNLPGFFFFFLSLFFSLSAPPLPLFLSFFALSPSSPRQHYFIPPCFFLSFLFCSLSFLCITRFPHQFGTARNFNGGGKSILALKFHLQTLFDLLKTSHLVTSNSIPDMLDLCYVSI